MDILKKMFGLNGGAAAVEKDAAILDKNAKSKVPAFGNDFKKPIWYDEESDDELFDNNKLFGFQVFSDPMEIQKYHEQQLQQMLKTFEQLDGTKGMFEENFREEYMKPGFENFPNVKPGVDVDLDGEIYADQLHSLLQRISPELENMRAKQLAKKKTEPKRKLTDEEKFMDQIHGIDEEEKRAAIQPFNSNDFGNQRPNVHIPHYGGAFEGVTDGPKTRRQTFSYQVIRKPEGTFTTSTVVDPDGNTKTVIKRTVDGETKTQTLINGVDINDDKNAIAGNVTGSDMGTGIGGLTAALKQNDWIIDCGRHVYVNKQGYALPKNFW